MPVLNYPIVAAFLLVSNLAYAQIYEWKDENGNTHFSDKPPPQHLEKVHSEPTQTLAKPSRKHQLQDADTIILDLRSMLLQRQYQELNQRLRDYQTKALEDSRHEVDLVAAYQAFSIRDPSFERYLSEWVEATPAEYAPYVARAYHYYKMGWKERGGKYANETSQDRFQRMEAYFDNAARDINQALVLDNQPMAIYSLLIDIARSQGNESVAKAMMLSALEIHPHSLAIRQSYLTSLKPRWGGSYEAMRAYIQQSQSAADLNPKIKLLKGFIFADSGDIERGNSNYRSAEELYTRALVFGDNSSIFKDRGIARYRQGHYETALEDFNRAIEIYSGEGIYYYWRSRTLDQLSRYNEAIEDIQHADALSPGFDSIIGQRKRLAQRMVSQGYDLGQAYKHQEAIQKYSIAIEIDRDFDDAYHRRAIAYVKVYQFQAALADIERALELDPHNISYYITIDGILARSKDWDAIIAYWDRFIELHPDVSRAYVERAGTYYHNGDMKAAVRDLKVAAGMGDPRGQELYERFKGYAD